MTERVMIDLTEQFEDYAKSNKESTPEIFRGYVRKWVDDIIKKR